MKHHILTRYGRLLFNKWFHIALTAVVLLLVFYDEKPPSNAALVNSQIEHLLHNPKDLVGAIETGEREALLAFYRERDYMPLWQEHGDATAESAVVIKTLKNAHEEGLNPADYNVSLISQLEGKTTPRARAELEIQVSLALTHYVRHLRNGRVSQAVLDDVWPKHPDVLDGFKWLRQGVTRGNLLESLYAQTPPHEQYHLLREQLRHYRNIQAQGAWSTLPESALLKPGMSDSRVKALRKRLAITGDLASGDLDNPKFDTEVILAISRFQSRHGILTDGMAGAETLGALNVSVEHRIKQIEMNMERWRYMQRRLGHRYVLVNAAGYELEAVEEDEVDLYMRVIVGKSNLATPVFSSYITDIIVNPEWHVPRSISVNELLPKVLEDPGYLTENNFGVYRFNGQGERRRIDPRDVNWAGLGESYFPYEIIQGAGIKNPLGRVKFFIPNFHDVYLHDTPHRFLFDHVFRNLSHGCIRLENPKALIDFVLKHDSIWNTSAINEFWDNIETQTIELKSKVPVHIFYFTSWVDRAGRINFYDDIYNYDARIENLIAGGYEPVQSD